MSESYHIDRDPRPKSHPCRYCARDVETGRTCLCVPAQPRSVPLTLGRPLRFLDEEPDI